MKEEASVELRPGVRRPDWTAVTKPAARDALLSRSASRSSVMVKWSCALEPLQDIVWQTVLELFARLARAPRVAEIADETGMAEAKLTPVLSELSGLDLLGVDEAKGAIAHAYPFAGRITGHRVELHGHELNALCAIDALGVGAMYRSDVSIESTCQWCRAPIRIITAESGRALRVVTPSGSVVWYDDGYEESAAASCCPMIVFFCSDDHLQQWRAPQRPPRSGCRLALDEALEVGRAIFAPILSTA